MKPLNWAPVTPYAIHSETAWYSGRVMDTLLVGKISIVGTSHGGVWRVDSSRSVVEGFDTRCLTDDWDDPKVNCLAHGPDNNLQVYAGCETTLRFFELDNNNLIAASVLLNLPVSNPHIVFRILIQKEFRRIIIPPDPANGGAYTWTKASGLPGEVISGLCHGANHAIHAGIFGDGSATGNNFGVFKGLFQNSNFNFTRSEITWHDTVTSRDMERISLASCANNRSAAFAAVSKSERGFRGVLKYNEAQDLWEDILNQKNFNDAGRPDEPGTQGEFNNAIAVAPDDSNLVALGWQRGTFVFNPSRLFEPPGKLNVIRLSKLEDVRIRGDVHSLHFTKSGNGEHELYIGGDGGLLKVSGPARTHHSFEDHLNVFLPTLLFKDELRAKQYATMDASPTVDGLIAGGLQDNGCKWLKTAKDKYTAWQQMLGGDGGTNTFLANGILISRESNTTSKFKSHIWNPQLNSFDDGSAIPTPVAVESDPKMEICTRIPSPAFRSKQNKLMHAISAAVQETDGGNTKAGDNLLLGLFENAEGSTKFHWKIIGVMPSLIKAAASVDGKLVYVSTADGKIRLLSPQKFLDGQPNPFTDLPLPTEWQTVKGNAVQFEITKTAVFALFEESAGGANIGHILVLDGNRWKEISTPAAETIYSIAADWDLAPNPLDPEDKRLFFSTDAAVYQGVQSTGPQLPGFQTAFNWQKSTDGLPARPHCTHLRLGWDEEKLFLYLSTYGRSVYRAQLRELVRLPHP
jgi:hypothetical protein